MENRYDFIRYFPKKSWEHIVRTEKTSIFNISKGRNINFYTVWLKDGDRICGTTIKAMRIQMLQHCGRERFYDLQDRRNAIRSRDAAR